MSIVTWKNKYKVVCQPWVEYERGWGNRPDGYSLHLSEEDRNKFVEGFNIIFNNKEHAPDEYSVAQGKPFVTEVDMDMHDTLVQNIASEHSHEFFKYGQAYPGKLPEHCSLDLIVS